MAPRAEDVPMAVTRKFPTNRNKNNISIDDWLLGREADDGAEGLWRIHDDLYDLTDFMDRHPGGRDWLQLSKGSDITEAFEVHHIRDNAAQLLPKFHVGRAKTPRNSLMTFKEDGFYKTLKRRLQKLIKDESGPTIQSKMLADFFALMVMSFAVLGARWSPYFCIVSGLFLHFLIVTSHNFFHMKDNWRMYYFNLSFMSYRDWRISHVLSHHIFPNTVLDLEVSMWEPLFQYLPATTKTLTARYLPWVISPIMFLKMFHFQGIRRVKELIAGSKLEFQWNELVCLSIPLVVYLFGGVGLWTAFVTWNYVIFAASFIFGVVGLTAAHHHPDIFHEGDAYVENKDFGMFQLAAVRDRIEVNENFFLVMISFGDHALHHLFPTIDHYRLPKLYPVFLKTCEEFGLHYKLYHARDLFTGMYKQLARNYTNAQLMILKNNN